jgi:hypothetical protein
MASSTSEPQPLFFVGPTVPPHMTQALPSGDPAQYFHWALNHFRDKSLSLGTQLAVCVQQLQMTTKYQQILERKHHELSQELKECRAQLEQRDQDLQASQDELKECRAQLEQTDLVQRIWAPMPSLLSAGNKKKRAYMEDASTGELLLIPVDKQSSDEFLDHPLTVKRVASENGYKCSKQDLYKLSGHIYSAFLAKNGRPPHLKILRDLEGLHHSTGCFVERDRGLILAVLEKFGEPAVATSLPNAAT